MATREISNITAQTLQQISDVLSSELNESNEDLILNALSCLSNILFFSIVIPDNFAESLLLQCKPIMEKSTNCEMRIECLRIFGNLSRTKSLIPIFGKLKLVDVIYQMLSNAQCTPREKYYSIGVLINLSSDDATRDSQMYALRLDLMLTKLQESDFEDLELSKNICKLLTNLCDQKTAKKWTNEQLDKLDKILTNLGDECDSTLVFC